MVTNLSLFASVIMNKFPMTNIIPAASVTNVCNFYKSAGIIMYSYLSTLFGLCLNLFTLQFSKSGPKIDFVLVMSIIVMG